MGNYKMRNLNMTWIVEVVFLGLKGATCKFSLLTNVEEQEQRKLQSCREQYVYDLIYSLQ